MTKNIKKNINKIYPKEFKQEAIKMALESPSITGTAKCLGIPEANASYLGT